MKYIKTYEGLKDIFMKFKYPNKSSFDKFDMDDLKKFGFYSQTKDEYFFGTLYNNGPYVYDVSNSDNIKQFIIEEFYKTLPELQGRETKYKLTILFKNNKKKTKYFGSLFNILFYIEDLIPEEIALKNSTEKYNL